MTQRTVFARQALDEYCRSKGEPLDTMESGIIDLMADLLHLAEQKRLDAYTVARTALKHHLVEMEMASPRSPQQDKRYAGA